MRASVLAPLSLILLAACNRTGKLEIAVIPKATSHVFWQSVHAGALAAGKQFQVSILWVGPPRETDFSRQLEIFDSMVARHVSGIAVAADDRDALNHSLDRAAAENIPVTVFDSGVSSNNYMTFVATDNFQAGQMAARTLAQLLHGKGEIAEIAHASGSSSTMDRERGFEEAMASEFPGVHIAAKQFGMSDRAKAMAVTENILTANTALDGLFASSEPSSAGASQAVKARGLGGKIRFVGFDASEGLVEDLKAGVIDALIAQDPYRIGFDAVRTLVVKLRGEAVSKRTDLHARVITRNDLAKPEIHALLFPDLSSLDQ